MSFCKCSVPGCKSQSTANASFFTFPNDNQEMVKTWCQNMNIDINTIKLSTKICHHHFEKKYIKLVTRKKSRYAGKKHRHLNSKDAIPTILEVFKPKSTKIDIKNFETMPVSIQLEPLQINVESILRGFQKIKIAENDEIKILDINMDSSSSIPEAYSSSSTATLSAQEPIPSTLEEAYSKPEPSEILFKTNDENEQKAKKRENEKVPVTELKELRRLDLGNNSTFFNNWNPLQSRHKEAQKEICKVNKKRKPRSRRKHTPLHDEYGLHLESGLDLCDCLIQTCSGCHFPCKSCGSEKCGPECRAHRAWIIDEIEVEGTSYIFRHPWVAQSMPPPYEPQAILV